MRDSFLILALAAGVLGTADRPDALDRSAQAAAPVPAAQTPPAPASAGATPARGAAGRAVATGAQVDSRASSAPAGSAPASSAPSGPSAGPGDAERRLRAVAAEGEALAKERQSLLGELRKLELDRQARGLELAKLAETLAALTTQSAATEARAAQASRDLASLKPLVRDRLVRLYKLGRLGYSRLLLNAQEARTFRETTQIIGAMARRDRALLDRYRTAQTALAGEQARLDLQRRELAALQPRLQEARAALDRAIAARTARVKEIQGREDLNQRLLAEIERARGRLDASVTGLAPTGAGAPAGTAAGNTATGGTTVPASPAGSGSPASAAAAPGAMVAGSFTWPVGGPTAVTSAFGRERTSRFGTQIARNGIQIEAADEQPVRAARAGTVAFADRFEGFGQLVILEHGGKTFTLYGHLASISVVRGDRVQQGQALGVVGRTPTGESALYFELRIDGRPVDPVRWLKR